MTISPKWPENGYIMRVPVINSAHLSDASVAFLFHKGAEFFGICATYPPYGYIVMLHDVSIDSEPEELAAMPEDLRNIVLWLEENRYEWVRFDSDAGEIIEGFPLFRLPS